VTLGFENPIGDLVDESTGLEARLPCPSLMDHPVFLTKTDGGFVVGVDNGIHPVKTQRLKSITQDRETGARRVTLPPYKRNDPELGFPGLTFEGTDVGQGVDVVLVPPEEVVARLEDRLKEGLEGNRLDRDPTAPRLGLDKIVDETCLAGFRSLKVHQDLLEQWFRRH